MVQSPLAVAASVLCRVWLAITSLPVAEVFFTTELLLCG